MYKFKIRSLIFDWVNGIIMDENRKLIFRSSQWVTNKDTGIMELIDNTGYSVFEDVDRIIVDCEIIKWIKKNTQCFELTHSMGHGDYKYEIIIDLSVEFLNAEEAMAFKLRWL